MTAPDKHTAHTVADWTGYLTHDEIDALKDLARSLPTGAHIVNIGAGNGTSGLAFMEARDDLQVTTIDIQRESSPYGCLAGEEAVFKSAGFWGDPRHTQIEGDSKAVAVTWSYGPVDMVFVDGGHQYHEAKGDIVGWLPHIKPGGIMVVHDFEKEVKAWRGVNEAVNELLVGRYERVLRVDTTIAVRVPVEGATWPESKSTPPESKPTRRRGR
jgi:predicted O-methyltransferase YrrM